MLFFRNLKGVKENGYSVKEGTSWINFLSGSSLYLKLKEQLIQQNGGLHLGFTEARTSSVWLQCRLQMEKVMAGTETRKVRRGLIMRSIECFSKESGLILKMVGAAPVSYTHLTLPTTT